MKARSRYILDTNVLLYDANALMAFPEAELDKLRVLMTVVGGQIVHEATGAF